jgi:hypothetical protein
MQQGFSVLCLSYFAAISIFKTQKSTFSVKPWQHSATFEFLFISHCQNMKHLLLCLCTLLLTFGCSDDKKQVETLQTETETIHDDAMKDMAEMNRLAREIKQKIVADSLTSDEAAPFTAALANIGNAENNMMAWMADYKAPSDKPASEAVLYLQEQKKLIEKNYTEIKEATIAAKKLLPQ